LSEANKSGDMWRGNTQHKERNDQGENPFEHNALRYGSKPHLITLH